MCFICGRVFPNAGRLGRHELRHRRTRRRPEDYPPSPPDTPPPAREGAGRTIRLSITVELVEADGTVCRRLFQTTMAPATGHDPGRQQQQQ